MIRLVPLRAGARSGELLDLVDALAAQGRTLSDLLRAEPCLGMIPLGAAELSRPLAELDGSIAFVTGAPLSTPLYLPEAVNLLEGARPAAEAVPSPRPPPAPEPSPPPAEEQPEHLDPAGAVARAYGDEIDAIAASLRARLSVLVTCDKSVVPYLWPLVVARARVPPADDPTAIGTTLEPRVLESKAGGGGGLFAQSAQQQQLEQFRQIVEELKPGQLLVVPHLDLLVGGTDKLSREGADITELVYRAADRLILAFADRTLPVPEVLTSRFASRVELAGLRREVRVGQREVPVGRALVTRDEARLWEGYDPVAFFKVIGGLSPVRLREAMAFAVQSTLDQGFRLDRPAPFALLTRQIRAFKRLGSEQFEVPTVRFEEIGGYDEVKATLERAIQLMMGAHRLPDERLRHELIPRGFLFYGPPGTGKTLFAKAIATRLDGTIRVVSGPEVTDKYVGEGERKIRELFAEARRNAPSVLVFDEFDAIAGRRTGRDDGGSRAGNAMVAQILTEMDGFRPDVPMLVIGTTNRLELIDAALLRPSRFQPVGIDLPDTGGRRAIAEIHARHFRVPAEGASLEPALLDAIAAATDGFNGDQIRSVFRDACVGLYCEGRAVTARALGVLVGTIRAGLAQQERDAAQEARPTRREDGRVGPSGTLRSARRS